MMKRWIAALLLLCTVWLAACDTATDVPDGSTAESETVSDTETGELRHTLISVGKTYTTNGAGSDYYTDLFGTQITDGQKVGEIGVPYTDVRMVAYVKNAQITFDLGEDGERISGVAVRALDLDRDGVRLPLNYRVHGSQDGQTDWTYLGRVAFEPVGFQAMSTAALYFDEVQSYRYLRVSVSIQGNFFFTDEIEIYADVDPAAAEKKDGAAALYASETINRDEWKKISTGKQASASGVNIAAGKTYTFEDCVFDARAPQNDTHLTDSVRTGRLFGEDLWVGFQPEGVPSVTVDLGKQYGDLGAFRVHTLGSGTGIALPDAIDVYASSDGKTFTLLGRIYAPAACDNHAYTLLLPEYIGARYVKFAFAPGAGSCWIEEIEIMAGEQTVYLPEDELYPPLDFTYPTEEIYWDSTDADYTERQNLLLGVLQQVAASGYEPLHELDPDPVKQSEWDVPVLTDGKLAADMFCYSGQWFYASGCAYDIFFDIGALSSVDTLEISLLEQSDWGIARPKYISVFLSEDGERWYEVVEDACAADTVYHKDATRLTYTYTLDTAFAARYVRFRFEAARIFVDELQAFGTKAVTDQTARLKDSDILPVIYYTDPEREQYANNENTTVKADEIVCFYGNYGDEDVIRAYVAYLDEDGNAVDTLMNGFLYGAQGSIPSGVANHLGNYKIDWEYYYDSIFNGPAGLDVMDRVVGEVKEELGIPDYKVYIYITMLAICEPVTDFGDVDGDGVSENLSVAADRKKVVDWYTDMCIGEFNARGYENLVLDGFYWHNESVSYENDDSHIIAEVSEYVHAKNTNYLWIPYYTANRYFLGYELGFDLVCMQPNYAFDLTQPMYRFTVTASRTERQHMCVEIEHTGAALYNPMYAQNYMNYLYYGVKTGYMHATHIYYNDLENFANLAYSDNPLCRMQYDATYKFTKGTLEIKPETRDTLRFTAQKDTVLEDVLHTGDMPTKYTLASAPQNGYITLTTDGVFRYFPDKGFTGTDSFTYTYNNYLGESETCTVEITVE